MNGGTKTTKKRVSKKTSESHDRDAMRGIVEDILRSMADDKVPAKVPRKETLMKRTEMNNLRDSIKQLETNVSVQFTQVDQKLNTLKAIIDEMQVNINKKNEQWEHELRSCVASIGEVQEKDKAKTLKTLQKMHMQHEADVTDTKSAVREVQRISNDAVQSLKDNVKALAKEVLHNKGSIDDMKRKAHDSELAAAVAESMRPPAGTEFYNYGVDTSVTIDHMNRRIKALEFRVADAQESSDAALAQTTYHSSGGLGGVYTTSPPRSRFAASKRTPSTPGNSKMGGHNIVSSRLEDMVLELDEKTRRLEKNHAGVKSRIDGNERAIKEVTKHIASIRAAWGSNESAGNEKRRSGKRNSEGHSDEGEYALVKEQQQHLQAKIKSLSHSTSRACRSLSVGVSDSQHATLLLYSWAEKVHGAFRDLSLHLELDHNPCPRPQIHDTSGTAAVLDVSAFLPLQEDM